MSHGSREAADMDEEPVLLSRESQRQQEIILRPRLGVLSCLDGAGVVRTDSSFCAEPPVST